MMFRTTKSLLNLSKNTQTTKKLINNGLLMYCKFFSNDSQQYHVINNKESAMDYAESINANANATNYEILPSYHVTDYSDNCSVTQQPTSLIIEEPLTISTNSEQLTLNQQQISETIQTLTMDPIQNTQTTAITQPLDNNINNINSAAMPEQVTLINNNINIGNNTSMEQFYTNPNTFNKIYQTNFNEVESLFPECYTSDLWFNMEQKLIFNKSWVCVGHYDEVRNDGDSLCIDFGNNLSIIISNNKNKLYGYYNVCRHRGSQLLKPGKYKANNIIKCPYHCWTYSNKGDLIGTPYFNNNKLPLNKAQKADANKHVTNNNNNNVPCLEFNKKDYNLYSFEVRCFMSLIWINLNNSNNHNININNVANNMSNNDLWNYQFGDLDNNFKHYPWNNLRIVNEINFDIHSNWKLIAENFIEYYHLPWVHPELCEISSVANHLNNIQGMGQYILFATSPLTNGGTPSDLDRFPLFNNINELDKKTSWFIHIFPNVSIWLFPHHLVTLVTTPISSNKTMEKLYILFEDEMINNGDSNNNNNHFKQFKENYGKNLKELSDFWTMVNKQDITAVENLQKGLEKCSNVYRSGKLSPKFEKPINRFHKIVCDYFTNNYMKSYDAEY